MVTSKENGKVLNMQFWSKTYFNEIEPQLPKDLTDFDICALRYVLMEIVGEKEDYDNGFYEITRDKAEEESCVQGDLLYVGDFEGYKSENTDLTLSYLYISTDGKNVIAVFEDAENDKQYHFLVY